MVFVLFLSCADGWQHADLQLDLTNASWQRESRMRTCIAQQQNHQSAVQAGRVAIDFLNFPIEATVQLLPPIEIGEGPTHEIHRTFEKEGHYTAEWQRCTPEGCSPCNGEETQGSGSVLMAIRLNDRERDE